MVYDWSDLNINKITNLYLYGSETTPAEYADRLRTLSEYNALPIHRGMNSLEVHVDMPSYMAEGAGRYAHASESAVVENFFNGNFILPDGSYTKADILNYLKNEYIVGGMTEVNAEKAAAGDFNIFVKQSVTDVESADYALRTYGFNNTSFTLGNATTFVFASGAASHIENLTVLAYDDNFDFQTAGTIAEELYDEYILGDAVDPDKIGVPLEIEYENANSVPTYEAMHSSVYNYSAYTADHAAALAENDGFLLLDALPAMTGLVGDLITAGTIEYVTATEQHVQYGSWNNDTMVGDELLGTELNIADDIMIGGDGNDIISAGIGDNIVYGGAGNDTFILNGTNIVDGGSGSDTLDYSGAVEGVEVSMQYGTVRNASEITTRDWFTSVETFKGTAFDDTFRLHTTAATVVGGDGADWFFSSTGTHTITGGAGTDTLSYYNAGQIVNINMATGIASAQSGGILTDTFTSIEVVHGSWAYSNSVNGSSLADSIVGGNVDDSMRGGSGNDTLWGQGGNDTLQGDIGNDLILGGAGNDLFYGNLGSDTIFGGDGDDDIQAGSDNDSIYGEAGNDNLHGAFGDDYLSGDDGNDTLNGYLGNDQMAGGAGDDTFVFDIFTEAQNDTISGFDGAGVAGGDLIRIGGGYTFADLVFTINSPYNVEIDVGSTHILVASFDTVVSTLTSDDFLFA